MVSLTFLRSLFVVLWFIFIPSVPLDGRRPWYMGVTVFFHSSLHILCSFACYLSLHNSPLIHNNNMQ